MTREEHLVFCRKCTHREFDPTQGLVCDLTQSMADFEENCPNFNLDPEVKEIPKDPEVDQETNQEVLSRLNDDAIDSLKKYQDFNYALVGGLFAMLIGAILWAIISVSAEFQIGYMAIGVGLLVGFAIRFFGAGIDKKFGILGAVLALGGCVLGNLFTQVGFIANYQSLGYFETLSYLTPSLIVEIMADSFHPLDVLFYGFAVVEGYRFSFRRLSGEFLAKLPDPDFDAAPGNYKLRLPLVIIGIVAISLFVFRMGQGVNGTKIFYYDSGEVMSQGEMKNSKEHGNWTFWHENGNMQAKGSFHKGLRDGSWEWYNEDGAKLSSGQYKKGVEHGTWINYHKNGNIFDSGSYVNGRMHGYWISYYENGNPQYEGFYNRNYPDSTWTYYHMNGQISGQGHMKKGNPRGFWTTYYEDGNVAEVLEYLDQGETRIHNAWDKDQNPLVVNGNGFYKTFSAEGNVLEKGTVTDTRKAGLWESFYESGNPRATGEYIDEKYFLINAWDEMGNLMIKDGAGIYISYGMDGVTKIDSGAFNNGQKQGRWRTFYETTGKIALEEHYVDGKLNGMVRSYYESGMLFSEGEMKNDLREGEWLWYHQNGTISSKITYHENMKEGRQIIYSDTGEEVGEELYENDQLIDEKYL